MTHARKQLIGHALIYPVKGANLGVHAFDFGYEDQDGKLWWCLRGDMTDYHSIPTWAVPLTGPRTAFPIPSFLHDSAYAHQQYSRVEADKMFREVLGICGANRLHRNTFYRAVRLGGGRAWRDQNPFDTFRTDLLPDYILRRHSYAMIPDRYLKRLAKYRNERREWRESLRS